MNDDYTVLAPDRPVARSDSTTPGARWRSSLAFGLVAATVLAFDQVTKRAVAARLPAGGRWPGPEHPIADYFTFTHVHNTGMAFGLGQGMSPVFLTLAIVVTGVLVAWQWRLPPEERLVRAALGLQVGGALGNAFDRVRQGWVTDFLDFQFWPVFNVADSAISVGVALLAISLWREGRAEHRQRLREAREGDQSAAERHSAAPDGAEDFAEPGSARAAMADATKSSVAAEMEPGRPARAGR